MSQHQYFNVRDRERNNIIEKKLADLCKRITNSPGYNAKEYRYFVWPYKGIFPINPEDLEDILLFLEKLIKGDIGLDFSTIFTFMTDGEIIAIPLALRLKKRVVARDYHYQLPDLKRFRQKTGYYEREMYFTGITSSDRIVIVDVILSTGGSIAALLPELNRIGCEICGVYTVANKVRNGGEKRLKDLDLKCKSLLNVEFEGGKVEVTPNF